MDSRALSEAQRGSDDPLAGESAFYRHGWTETPLGPAGSWPDELRMWVRFMLPSVQPILLIWGPERVLLFNRSYAGLLGDRWRDAFGAKGPVVWAAIWPEIKCVVDDVFAGNAGLMEPQPVRSFASGFSEPRYYSRSYTPIKDADGRVLGGAIFTREHTAEVQEQRRVDSELGLLKNLLEKASSFAVVTECKSHRITYTNAAFRDLIHGRDVMGQTVEQAFPELVQQKFFEMLDRVFETGEPVSVVELPLAWQADPEAEPQWRYITAVYQALRDQTGTIIGVLAEGHEVTQHVLAQRALLDVHNELLHVARVNAMGTMAATLAHELNQPLAAATNYLMAARRIIGSGGDPVAVDALTSAGESLLRAGSIIRSLRTMTDDRESKYENFDVRLAALETVKLIRAAGLKGADIGVEGAAELIVVGDRVQIEQVLVNLVKNAVEATATCPTRKVSVILGEAKGKAEIAVSDTGPGVMANMARSLFDAFATEKGTGMGVGLSICRTIVERHGGRIWLEHSSQSGATFCFTLPLAREEGESRRRDADRRLP